MTMVPDVYIHRYNCKKSAVMWRPVCLLFFLLALGSAYRTYNTRKEILAYY